MFVTNRYKDQCDGP